MDSPRFSNLHPVNYFSTPDDVKKLLTPDEKVEMYIPQKIYNPKISIDSLVFTNERIILR